MSVERIVLAVAGLMILLSLGLGVPGSPIFHNENWRQPAAVGVHRLLPHGDHPEKAWQETRSRILSHPIRWILRHPREGEDPGKYQSTKPTPLDPGSPLRCVRDDDIGTTIHHPGKGQTPALTRSRHPAKTAVIPARAGAAGREAHPGKYRSTGPGPLGPGSPLRSVRDDGYLH